MKPLISTLQFLTVSLFMFLSANLSAQSGPLYIYNHTGCYFEFNILAHDYGCTDDACQPGIVCIVPGTNVISPCGPSHVEWAAADVVPVDANCEFCGVYGSTVERINSCGTGTTRNPRIATCDNECGTVTVSFISPFEIMIN